MIPTVLSIAGSDPSGGAGIQADLKTFSRLKVYGMAVVTALTAQNTEGVRSVMRVPPAFFARQLAALLEDIHPLAAKTGMLSSRRIVELTASMVRRHRVKNLVVDPVLVSTSGVPLLEASAVRVLVRELLPAAILVTPNLAEAAVLTGHPVRTLSEMEEAARRLCDCGVGGALVKGGHLRGEAVDVFYDGTRVVRLASPRLGRKNIHGTGCVLSAAIAAYLALGEDLPRAVQKGKRFVTHAIAQALPVGKGDRPCNPLG